MSNQTFFLLLLICVGAFAVDHAKSTAENPPEAVVETTESLSSNGNNSVFSDTPWPEVGTSELTPASAPATFQCDHRQYCTEMTSLAEARYFVVHCPNTQMDGDHDGEPCENDTRFHPNR